VSYAARNIGAGDTVKIYAVIDAAENLIYTGSLATSGEHTAQWGARDFGTTTSKAAKAKLEVIRDSTVIVTEETTPTNHDCESPATCPGDFN